MMMTLLLLPTIKWQYWVDDGVDGKVNGWYDYTLDGSRIVEQLHQEHLLNKGLSHRTVKSGHWKYNVDLKKMVQMNIQHKNKTSRRIRRFTKAPPTKSKQLKKSKKGSKEPKKKNTTLAKPTEPSIDTEIRFYFPNNSTTSNFSVAMNDNNHGYDVEFNLRDTSEGKKKKKKDKYYHLQLLKCTNSAASTKKFFLWLKWGTKADAQSTKRELQGPFQNKAVASKVFAKALLSLYVISQKYQEAGGFDIEVTSEFLSSAMVKQNNTLSPVNSPLTTKSNQTRASLVSAPLNKTSTNVSSNSSATSSQKNTKQSANISPAKSNKTMPLLKKQNKTSTQLPSNSSIAPSKMQSKKTQTSTAVKQNNTKPSQTAKKAATPPVDKELELYYSNKIPGSRLSVVSNQSNHWYDAVLQICDITGNLNNNKYYRLQLLTDDITGQFFTWLSWGRVGSPSSGRNLLGPFSSEKEASKVFAKKYKEKTKNKWGADEFVPAKGKYNLVDIDYEVDASSSLKGENADPDVEILDSKLEPKTRELIEVLFSKETRDIALTSFGIDLKKLPLGVPSQQQIQNGVSILNQIEAKLNGDNVPETFDELSSRFYSVIPHSFGRKRPLPISDKAILQTRYDMTNILLDMFDTSETLRKIETKKVKKQVPNPADLHYETLRADLSLVDPKSEEYSIIKKNFEETKSTKTHKLLNVWAVDRQNESTRYKKFDELDNRRLLWHGTNLAVVAPIITSGLRIMPHSGGLVGAGIYLASMQSKSAQYTSGRRTGNSNFSCMFLCEAAMGKMHLVTSRSPGLKKAPNGFDSVHAVGSFTPKSWTTVDIDGKAVQVPNSSGHSSGTSSFFHHDEFLIYDEAQIRLRYVLTMAM